MTEKELNQAIDKKFETAKDWMKGHDEAFLSNCDKKDYKLSDEDWIETYDVQIAVLKKLLFEVECKRLNTKFTIRKKKEGLI